MQRYVPKTVAEVENVNGSGAGNYCPLLLRAQGGINTNDFVFDVGQSSLDLVQDGDWFYPMGGSTAPLVLAKDNDDDTLCTLIYYDKLASAVGTSQYTTGDQVSGTLRKRANPGTSLATVQGSSYLVDLSADMNDDGTIDSVDGQLKSARLGKCIGINNSDDPTSGEDDLQEITLTCRGNTSVGTAWVEYDDTTMKLWEDLARTQPVLPGSSTSPNWDLASDTVPGHLYIEGLASSAGAVRPITFQTKKGPGKSAGGSASASVVKLGDKGYFAHVRSYLVDNNSKIFSDDLSLDGGFPSSPDLRLLAVRREKATLSVYDAKTLNKTDVDAVKAANNNATIVANGTFFTDRTILNAFGEWTVGSVVNDGNAIAPISHRVTNWNEKQRQVPEYRAFFGQASDKSIVSGRSDKNGGNEAVDQSPVPNAALSGLIAFLPNAKEEKYDTVLKRMDKGVHRSQYHNAMSHIGYAKEDEIIFLIFSPGNDDVWPHFYPNDLDRAAPGGLFEKLVTSAGSSVVCYGLDGGSSVGVAHKDRNGSWTTPSKGSKHRSAFWLVNNYVIINVAD